MRATSLAVVTLKTSSTVVMPWRTSRQPSSASVRMPCRRAASRIWSVEAFFKINWRISLSDVHPFENRVPAVKTGVAAFAAADGFVNRRVRRECPIAP